MADLIVLTADKNQQAAVRALLGRPQALRIRHLRAEVLAHPRHDPGCLNEAHDFLHPFATQYQHALVVLDHDGCGHEHKPATVIEQEVRARLSAAGGDRGAAVVIQPELEAWLWSPSPHVSTALGWDGRTPALRDWLRQRGLWDATPKPIDPKGAVEAAMREVRLPRSSSVYGQVGNRASVEGCLDASFGRFRWLLQSWFPDGSATPVEPP